MDLEVEDIESEGESILVLTAPNLLMKARENISKLGYVIESAELSYQAKSYMAIDKDKREKLGEFFDKLNELDDVQSIFSNLEDKND